MNSTAVTLSLALLTSSFLGSWHCGAMCGPIATFVAHKKGLLTYHFGRLISYVALGVLGGSLGSFFLKSQFAYLRQGAGLLFALILFAMAFQLFVRKKNLPLFKVPHLHRGLSPQFSAFTLGLLSIFLPCGWLYTYVMAAVATQDPRAGGLTLLLFWLGGLPALSAFPIYMKKAIAQSHERQQRISGFVLLFAGLYSLVSFYFL